MTSYRRVQKIRSRQQAIHEADDNLVVGKHKVLEKVGRRLEISLEQMAFSKMVAFKRRYGVDVDLRNAPIWKGFADDVVTLELVDFIESRMHDLFDLYGIYTTRYFQRDDSDNMI